jgi:V/A-type H+-transporting ATPase subunit F|tara:strand:+ start:830 stop:1150 length:321 start_codon:yes stop_codon:yes gene_type:complete
MEISVIGDSTTVLGFKLAGVKTAIKTKDSKEALEALKNQFNNPDIGLIIITEQYADKLRDEINRLTEGVMTPLIVEIPNKDGTIDRKVDPIKELVRRAVGVEIKFN